MRPQRAHQALSIALAIVAATACDLAYHGPPACGSARGGQADARSVLRFVDVNDQRVIFVFGLREGGGFGVPAYTIEPAVPGELDAFRLRFDGAWLRNADGSPSYDGALVFGKSELVRELRLDDDERGSLRADLIVNEPACPRVRAGEYAASTTFPRARVVLLFAGESAISVEPGRRAPGDPVTVSGLGFAAGAAVQLTLAGTEVHRTRADAAGDISSSFFLPPFAPGEHELSAADDAGHTAATRLAVSAPP